MPLLGLQKYFQLLQSKRQHHCDVRNLLPYYPDNKAQLIIKWRHSVANTRQMTNLLPWARMHYRLLSGSNWQNKWDKILLSRLRMCNFSNPSPNRIHLAASATWFISFLSRMELQVNIKGCNFLWHHTNSHGEPLRETRRTDDEVHVMTSLCKYQYYGVFNLTRGWDANVQWWYFHS